MSRGVLTPSYRKRTGYQAMLLGGMATLASALLVLGNVETRDDITQRQAEDLKASLTQVIPERLHNNDLLEDIIELPRAEQQPLTVYRARQDDSITAVAYEVVGYGYSGAIVSLMAVDDEGKLLGVRVLSHAETPGLGDKIDPSIDDWIYSFNGRSIGDPHDQGWAVKKDGGIFDQFTGATITPRAVVGSVHGGLQYYHQNYDALFAAPEPKAEEPVTEDKATPQQADTQEDSQPSAAALPETQQDSQITEEAEPNTSEETAPASEEAGQEAAEPVGEAASEEDKQDE